jgi:TAT (twin-arginine translocation) pathway signal sequence
MNSEVTRRRFIKAGAAAALATSLPKFAAADGARSPFIWGALLHMGTNMWSDVSVKSWGSWRSIST